MVHCPQKKPNLGISTPSLSRLWSGCKVIKNVRLLFTNIWPRNQTYCSICDRLGFMQNFKLLLGQCGYRTVFCRDSDGTLWLYHCFYAKILIIIWTVWIQYCFYAEICILGFWDSVAAVQFLSGMGTPFFSVRYVTFFSVLKKERYNLFRSFLEFLATYETQNNVMFFFVLFKRTEKNGKNVTFFCKERKRTERTLRSFAKNRKKRENVPFFCKRMREHSILFSIYI